MRAMLLQGAAARLGDLRLALSERDYRRYALGHFAATIAFWMQRIAVGWVVWEQTGSATWLGVIAFAELFPSILASFAGGELADRTSGPRVMFAGQLGVTSVAGALFWLQISGGLDARAVALCMVALGVVAGAMLPARLSMPQELVRPELLPSALAVNATGFNLSRMVGPALAAPLLALMGAGAVFFVCLAAGLAFLVMLAPIAWARGGRGPGLRVPTRAVFEDLRRERLTLSVILLQFAQGALIRPASDLFPAFADRAFGAGEAGLAALNAALGAGAVLGALALSKPREDAAALRFILLASAALCASLLAFAFTGALGWALLVLVIHGGALTGTNIGALTYVQSHTPADRRGRVLALYGVVFRVAPALGALVFGVVADLAGLRATTAAFALSGLGVSLLWWREIRPGGRTRPAAA